MPFRGILLFIVLAAIIAWFYKDEIYEYGRKVIGDSPPSDEDDDNKED